MKNPGILYVDDEEKSLKYFKRYFTNKFTVFSASNVSDAKTILNEQHDNIGILITDQRMPHEYGTELLKYARDKYPNIVRLLTTAYSNLDDAIEAVNNGEIYRYITKPWDVRLLEIEIKHAARYFIINSERDQLLNEKLRSQQRLLSVNIARDLIILSFGITHFRNPKHAIYSYLKQLITDQTCNFNDFQNHDLFQIIKNEIFKLSNISKTLITDAFYNESNEFEPVSIINIYNGIVIPHEQTCKTELNSDVDLPSIRANHALIEKLFINILNFFYEDANKNRSIKIFIEAINHGVQVKAISNQIDTAAISLPNISTRLLTAFFITYHHNGIINIDNIRHDAFEIKIFLPINPPDNELPALENNWIDEIMQHYENWYS